MLLTANSLSSLFFLGLLLTGTSIARNVTILCNSQEVVADLDIVSSFSVSNYIRKHLTFFLPIGYAPDGEYAVIVEPENEDTFRARLIPTLKLSELPHLCIIHIFNYLPWLSQVDLFHTCSLLRSHLESRMIPLLYIPHYLGRDAQDLNYIHKIFELPREYIQSLLDYLNSFDIQSALLDMARNNSRLLLALARHLSNKERTISWERSSLQRHVRHPVEVSYFGNDELCCFNQETRQVKLVHLSPLEGWQGMDIQIPKKTRITKSCFLSKQQVLITDGARVFLYDRNSHETNCIASCNGAVTAIAALENKIALGTSDGTLEVLRLDEHGQCTMNLLLRVAGGETTSCLAWAEQNRLISGGNTGIVRIWNIAHHQRLTIASLYPSPCLFMEKFRLYGCICVSQIIMLQSNWLATAEDDFSVKLWCIHNLPERTSSYIPSISYTEANFILKGHASYVIGIIQLNDGRLLTSAHDQTVKLWELEREEPTCIMTIPTKGLSCHSLMQLPDGRIACFTNKRTLILNLYPKAL